MRAKEKKERGDTFKRSKTHKYNSCSCHLYFCSTQPNLDKSNGRIKKERGKAITLLHMPEARKSFEELPNGRYYEYFIEDCAIAQKQVKTISYLYAQGEKAGVGVDLLEDLEHRVINSQDLCFDVKGGVKTYKEIKKPKFPNYKGLAYDPNKAVITQKSNEHYVNTISPRIRKNKELNIALNNLMYECNWLEVYIPHTIKDTIKRFYDENSHSRKSYWKMKTIDRIKNALDNEHQDYIGRKSELLKGAY